MSNQHCEKVVSSVLQHFKSGQMPSYFVMKCLADISQTNPIEFVSKLSEIYGRVVPVLGGIKRPIDQSVFTLGMGRFSEAILTFKSDADEKEQSEINFTEFESHTATAFDVMFANWRRAKEDKIRYAVSETLGLMCEIMDPKKFKTRFSQIIDFYIQSLKKEKQSAQQPLTRV